MIGTIHGLFLQYGDTKNGATALLALTGMSYGVCWNSLFHTLEAVFYNVMWIMCLFLGTTPALGPLVFNTIIIGYLNDEKATHGALNCVGFDCFKSSYLMLVVSDACALMLAVVILHWVSKHSLPIMK